MQMGCCGVWVYSWTLRVMGLVCEGVYLWQGHGSACSPGVLLLHTGNCCIFVVLVKSCVTSLYPQQLMPLIGACDLSSHVPFRDCKSCSTCGGFVGWDLVGVVMKKSFGLGVGVCGGVCQGVESFLKWASS